MDKEAKLRFREMVGANIRMARQRAGLSLEQLGEPLCLSRGSISIIERGGQAVSLEQLQIIAATLGVDADEIVPGVKSAPRQTLINPELARTLIKLGAARQHSLLRLLASGVIRPPDGPCPVEPDKASNGE